MGLLDLLCPCRCEGCGAANGPACTTCCAPLRQPPRRHRPSPCPAGLPDLWVVADYDATTRKLLIGFKEHGVTALAGVLSAALASGVRQACGATSGVVVVPVPSSRVAVRTRGEDVVNLLAASTARLLRRDGTVCRSAAVLTQARAVADSAGLAAVTRAANLREALRVRPGRSARLVGAPVVIIDDLVTTGTTLCEASRALRAAGADVIGAVTVAATIRRFAPSPS